MKRIDTINARENMFGVGKSGFHDNSDLPGQDATYVSPEWFNTVQEELCNLLELRGITLNPESKRQLYDLLTTQADLEALADEIETNFIRKSQIVDNLTTNDATKVASAKQVKILQDNKLDKTDLTDASTAQKGVVQLNNTLTSTSTTQALTAAQGKNLNDKMFGVDQGWKNITASTILNTEYTNTNPKTIFVTGVLNGDDQNVTLTVRNKNGDVFEIKCGTSPSSLGDVYHNVSAPIAPGESYKFSRSSGTLTIWMFS